jgi:hypothetical protein
LWPTSKPSTTIAHSQRQDVSSHDPVRQDDGSPVSIELQLRTRGHVRRMYQTCEFAPLRLEFTKAHVKGTVFDDQRVLKLGTHCRNVTEFEQRAPRAARLPDL